MHAVGDGKLRYHIADYAEKFKYKLPKQPEYFNI
jgi:hypothetical protein